MISNRVKILGARYSTFVALFVLLLLFGLWNSRFTTVSNYEIILLNIAELGLIVIPLAFLVMSGSVDLSVGSVASAGAVICALTMEHTHSVLLGIGAGLLFGIVAGAVNGLLVAILDLNPIVITLGFLGAWGGLALYLTQGATVANFPSGFTGISRFSIGPVQIQLVLLALAIVIGWFVLEKRPFGRQVLAIGGNRRAAHLMGVRVKKVRFLLFIATGVCAAAAGILISSKLYAAPPNLGVGVELNALTIILLGGVAFEGGAGRISGVVAGMLFIGALNNGLVLAGVSQFLQAMITGLTLVIAVALDRTIQKSVTSAWASMGAAEVRKAEAEPATAGRT